jgi:hypothetical protein
MAAAAAGELLSLSQVEFKPTRTYKSFLFLFSYSSAGIAILSLSSKNKIPEFDGLFGQFPVGLLLNNTRGRFYSIHFRRDPAAAAAI